MPKTVAKLTCLIPVATLRCSSYHFSPTIKPVPLVSWTSSSGNLAQQKSSHHRPPVLCRQSCIQLCQLQAKYLVSTISHLSGSSSQFSGRFTPSWGQAAQNNTNPPAGTDIHQQVQTFQVHRCNHAICDISFATRFFDIASSPNSGSGNGESLQILCGATMYWDRWWKHVWRLPFQFMPVRCASHCGCCHRTSQLRHPCHMTWTRLR